MSLVGHESWPEIFGPIGHGCAMTCTIGPHTSYMHASIHTLNVIFSVTCYLELHNAMIVYCASHVFTNHGRIGRLDTT